MVYTVRIEPDPQNDKNRADEQQYRKDQLDIARDQLAAYKILNWISGVGGAIAFFALIALIVNACYLSGQLGAALEANRINHYSLVVSQRAFVFIPNAFEENPGKDANTGDKLGAFTFRMENSGNTPATVTGNFINTNYYRTPNFGWNKLPDDFTFPDNPASTAFPNASLAGGRFILAPHDTENFQVVGIPENVFAAVDMGKAHVYFWGWVAYTDVFGCSHKTEFARELTSAQPIAPDSRLRFFIDNLPKHNCIDGDCVDYEKSKDPSCNETRPN